MESWPFTDAYRNHHPLRAADIPQPGLRRTADMNLGRLVQHDPRSRNYAAVRAVEPRSVLWRHKAPVLDQFYTSACFPPGTLIRMADGGEVPIEDVRLGEYVATAEGNTGRVVRTLLRDENQEVLRLMAWGHSHLRMTSEHPILTSRGYIPARELKRGDEIALPRYRPTVTTAAIEVAKYVNKPSHRLPSNRRWTGPVWAKEPLKRGSRSASIPEKIELDYDFGRFIGLFLAEGNCTEHSAVFTFADHEINTLAAEVADTATRLGIEPHIRVNSARHTTIVKIHSVGWSRLLSALCGNGAGMKQMHRDLAGGPDEFLHGVLTGWLDGDGCYRKGGAREGVSISRRLAMSMYDIGQVLDMHPVILRSEPTQNRHAAVRQPRWTVTFSPGSRAREDGKYTWRKLRHMERESYCGPVYDLTIEGDHSYIAEGVGVHNCTGFAMANCLNTTYFATSRPRRRYLGQDEALDLYSAATHLDEFPWTWPPDDEGSSGLGVAKAGVQIGYLSSYRHAFGFEHFTAALQLSPLIVGTAWHETMFYPDADGFITPDGDVVGGHEYMALGINHYNKVLPFLNSWGPSFGSRGRFHMTFDSFTRLLADDGDATIPLGRQ